MTRRVEPIRRSVTVRCPLDRAFRIFTEEIGSWWPTETHSRAAMEFEGEGLKAERIEFQTRVGGRVVERMSDGRLLAWGEVLVWEPPRRFVLAWKPHSRPDPPTEVEVTFTERESETEVVLEHRGWERLSGDVGRLHADYASGWVGALRRFAEAANREVA